MEQEPEVVTSEPVAEAVTSLPGPTPVDDRSLDDLLAEYDAKVGQAEPAQQEIPNAPPQDDASGELDQLLTDLSISTAYQQKTDALQSQLSELQAQVRRERDWQEFTSFSDGLQKQAAELSPHIDENFVRLRLESAAHNPEIRLAFDTRHIDPKAAALDLAHVQHSLRQLLSDPNADRGQIQQLQTLSYQLSVAANGPSILRRLKNTILSEAKNQKPPFDELATADHFAVAQAVREAAHGDLPAPPVNFATMTDREFKEYTRKNYGF